MATNATSIERDLPDGMFTTAMLCQRMQISQRELNMLALQGKLKSAKRSKRGWTLYDQRALAVIEEYITARDRGETSGRVRLPRLSKNDPNVAYSTEDAAKVLELVTEGMALKDVFLRTRIHPSMIYAIIKDFETMAGFMVWNDEQTMKLRSLSIEGIAKAKTFEEFYKIILMLVAERRCQSCGKKRRSAMCPGCTREMMKENAETDEDGEEETVATS